jgi:hypothetical protein
MSRTVVTLSGEVDAITAARAAVHLKDPSTPRKVTLKKPSQPPRRKVSELTGILGLSITPTAGAPVKGNGGASQGGGKNYCAGNLAGGHEGVDPARRIHAGRVRQ